MTKTRRITPHEWIQDYFSPVVSVLSSPEAESLARTNNLSVTELVQPFSKLSNDITLKDPEGTNHSVSGLAVQFEDWRRDPGLVTNTHSFQMFALVSQMTVVQYQARLNLICPKAKCYRLLVASVPLR